MVERGGRRAGLVALAVIVLMISAAACSKSTPTATGSTGTTTGTATQEPTDSGSGDGGGGTIPIGDDQANNHGSGDVTGKSETSVEQDNFFFTPTVLTGSAGQSLKIEVHNGGSVPHTFTIDAQNVDVQVEPGEDATVNVAFPDSGVVEFYCRFHHGSGMAGELKVA